MSRKFSTVLFGILVCVAMVAPALAFDANVEDLYSREQYMDRYVGCSGFVQSEEPGLLSNWGANIRLVDAGLLSGLYNVDFWNFSSFKGGWPDGEGHNEVDWTVLKLGDFLLGDRTVKYQVGVAYLDFGSIFDGFRGDYMETVVDFLYPLYSRGNFSLFFHLRDEALFLIEGEGGSAGTFNYVGFLPEYRCGRITLSAQVDMVADDGLITNDPAGIFLFRPAVTFTVIDNTKNRLDIELANRTTVPVIGGEKRDGTETGFYAGLVWKPKVMNW